MKRIAPILLAGSVIAIALPNHNAQAADVGISVTVGQPGFYGRIDIGNAPAPQVIYAKPVIISAPVATPTITYVQPAPIYLRVPPGHAKKWSKHCHRYQACNQPVYFVRDHWYQNVYVPHYQKHHAAPKMRDHDDDDKHGKNGKSQGKGHGKGHEKKNKLRSEY